MRIIFNSVVIFLIFYKDFLSKAHVCITLLHYFDDAQRKFHINTHNVDNRVPLKLILCLL